MKYNSTTDIGIQVFSVSKGDENVISIDSLYRSILLNKKTKSNFQKITFFVRDRLFFSDHKNI